MKKPILTILVLLGFVLMLAPVSSAQVSDEVSFPITVTLPTATGVSIVAVRVDYVEGGDDVWGTTPVSSFDFNPLGYLTTAGIWAPNHYYAIDVGVTGGAGLTTVTVQYAEGTRPTGQALGLGFKAAATFRSVSGAPGSQTEADVATSVGTRALLDSLTGGVTVTPAMLGSGFFRAYVGIYTGDDPTTTVDETIPGGVPFINTDVPGPYTGTLTVSATVT
jgi:hypothetical protein